MAQTAATELPAFTSRVSVIFEAPRGCTAPVGSSSSQKVQDFVVIDHVCIIYNAIAMCESFFRNSIECIESFFEFNVDK